MYHFSEKREMYELYFEISRIIAGTWRKKIGLILKWFNSFCSSKNKDFFLPSAQQNIVWMFSNAINTYIQIVEKTRLDGIKGVFFEIAF